MLIAWTGHRPDVFADPAAAQRVVELMADALIERSREVEFLSGAQRGVDQWAAAAAAGRGIPFHLVLPIPSEAFSASWDTTERGALQALIARAASIHTVDVGDGSVALAYDLRNEAIVRRADLLVAVWTGIRAGGTFHTICAARSRGLLVEEAVRPPRQGNPWQGGRGL